MGALQLSWKCLFFSQADIFTQVWQDGTGHFDCYPLLCCLLKALRFGSRCLYKLKAVLNAAPAQLMRGSLQNLHEMMLSNWWHKNVACNPPVQTLGVNMPAPPFSQRLLPVQTVSLPSLPLSKNTMTALCDILLQNPWLPATNETTRNSSDNLLHPHCV